MKMKKVQFFLTLQKDFKDYSEKLEVEDKIKRILASTGHVNGISIEECHTGKKE